MKPSFGRYAIVGAFLAATIAAISNVKYLQNASETEEVVVVTREVQAFEALDDDDLAVRPVPSSDLNHGALRSVSEAKGQYSRALLVKDQVVKREHLVDPSSGSLAARLTANRDVSRPPGGGDVGAVRAMALKVSADTGVANTLQAGDQVDVLVALKVDSPAQGRYVVSKIIARRVPVLYTAAQTRGDPVNGAMEATVVLQVRQQLAEELAFAQASGTIWLLTAPFQGGGDETGETAGVTIDGFLRGHGFAVTPAQGLAAAQTPTRTKGDAQ